VKVEASCGNSFSTLKWEGLGFITTAEVNNVTITM
jgi:hypothetical protein